jgi:hypothetical protein
MEPVTKELGVDIPKVCYVAKFGFCRFRSGAQPVSKFHCENMASLTPDVAAKYSWSSAFAEGMKSFSPLSQRGMCNMSKKDSAPLPQPLNMTLLKSRKAHFKNALKKLNIADDAEDVEADIKKACEEDPIPGIPGQNRDQYSTTEESLVARVIFDMGHLPRGAYPSRNLLGKKAKREQSKKDDMKRRKMVKDKVGRAYNCFLKYSKDALDTVCPPRTQRSFYDKYMKALEKEKTPIYGHDMSEDHFNKISQRRCGTDWKEKEGFWNGCGYGKADNECPKSARRFL